MYKFIHPVPLKKPVTNSTGPRWVVLMAKIASSVALIVNICAENVKRCPSSFSSVIKPQLETCNHIILIKMKQLWECSDFILALKVIVWHFFGKYTALESEFIDITANAMDMKQEFSIKAFGDRKHVAS